MGLAAAAHAQGVAYGIVDVTASPADAGTVTITPDQANHEIDSWVTLEAIPVDGYEFDHWSGDVTAYESPLTITVSANTELTAHFSVQQDEPAETYTLTLVADPSGAGSILRDPVAAEYAPGTEVTITAVAGIGFVFENWSGDVAELIDDLTSSEITIPVNEDTDVIANFAAAAVVTPLDPATGSGGSATSGGALCGSVGMISFAITATALMGWRRHRR